MKASIVGSIISNILLVLGAAMLVGGLGRQRQTFNKTAAHSQAAMLLLALVALAMPALFQLVHDGNLPSVHIPKHEYSADLEHISLAVAIILLISYLAGLRFSLGTHRDVFNPYTRQPTEDDWTVRRSVTMLAVAGVLVGADSMSRAIGVPTYIADVIVAASLISVLVATLLTQYRVRWR